MITLVKNIRQLVTPLGSDPVTGPQMNQVSVRERVQLIVRDSRVVEVVQDGHAARADRVIDAAGGVVVPGLVDPSLSATRSASFSSPTTDAELARLRSGAEAVLRQGTTTAEVCAVATASQTEIEELLAGLRQLGRRVALRISPAFLAAPNLCADSGSDDRISALIGGMIPSISERRLAVTCVVCCGNDGYGRKDARSVLRAARGAGLRLRIRASGADGDALLAALDVRVDAIDHLPSLTAGSRAHATLRKAETVPILLPSAHVVEADAPAPARPLLDVGLPVALASAADILTGGVLSLWTGVSLSVRQFGMSLHEALVAATLNAAAAVGQAHEVGTLEPGKLADFVILDLDDYRRIPDFVVGLPIRTVVVGGTEVAP